MDYYERCQLSDAIEKKISPHIELLSQKIDKQQNDIKNISDKVDNLTDKLTVLIDALSLIDQKVTEKK